MSNLFIILLLVFAGVALMVFLGERFASPANPEQLSKISRWLLPLVGLMLVLSLVKFYWQ